MADDDWLIELERVASETNWHKTVNCAVCNEVKEVSIYWKLKKTCQECMVGWREKYTRRV